MKLVNPKYSPKEEVIKVIGLGGAGSNAVNYMAKKYSSSNVYHICANTDSKHLNSTHVDHQINFGTNGLGAGMKIHIGEQTARESEEQIRNAISGADMLFLAAGMGGGTGTYAISVVAEIAKEIDILTVAVVTKPFEWEGDKKMKIANEGIIRLAKQVNSLTILPNSRLLDVLGKKIPEDMMKLYEASNDVLANSVNAVTDIISKTGYINIDFADIRTVMSIPGKAMISSGIAKGEDRAVKAIKMALSNPLIEKVEMNNAQGVLVNINVSRIKPSEYADINSLIEKYAHPDSFIKVGHVEDMDLGEELKVTVILTGLASDSSLELQTGCQSSIIDPDIEVKKEQQKVESLEANRDIPTNINNRQVPAYLRNRQKA